MNGEFWVVVMIAAILGGLLGFLAGTEQDTSNYKDGYRDGKEYVCSQPQTPFKRVEVPACVGKSDE
jgi:hypothetical protein